MVKRLNPLQIQKLAEGALDAACAFIQAEIGQTDGGRAGIFFSGAEAAEITGIFSRYIDYEQLDAESDPAVVASRPDTDAMNRFMADVKQELRALRELGLVVPPAAFHLACNRIGMGDYINMAAQECADLLRDLAALPGAAFSAPALAMIDTGGGCKALHTDYPYAKGAHVLVTDGDGEVSLPDDPENGALMFGVYTDTTPDGTLITLNGRQGMNDWFEATIGYKPDDEPGGPLPIDRLMALTAEAFFVHTHGRPSP